MNQKDIVKALVAQLIPAILLFFYVVAIGTAIVNTMEAADRCGKIDPACATAFHGKRDAGVNLILNLVGGLVSALVVAELAITKPGELPSAQLFVKKINAQATKKIDTFLSTAFIVVWLICGAASVLVYITHPNATSAALSEFGKAWLGIALASAYSYFGIK